MSKKHNAFTERNVQKRNIVRNQCWYQNVHADSTSFKPKISLYCLVQNNDSGSLQCIYFYICRQFVKSNVQHCQGYRLYINKCNENPYFGCCMQTSREKKHPGIKNMLNKLVTLTDGQKFGWVLKLIFDVETLLAAELANSTKKTCKKLFLTLLPPAPHHLQITFFHFLLAFSIIYFWCHQAVH